MTTITDTYPQDQIEHIELASPTCPECGRIPPFDGGPHNPDNDCGWYWSGIRQEWREKVRYEAAVS